jgi:hypothetical protein
MRMSERVRRKAQAGGQEQGNVAAAFGLAARPWSPKKHHSAIMNQMVSSPFRYVISKGYASFPARSLGGRSCNTIFLLSSTEV